ncbi:MAG: endolytic transglycosylase MltG [Lachnospiraceae bacterium]|nr:endolytic transglycosylase MltG [Lachnospiraceae bacterium]
MELKYYLRGLGLGIAITAIVMGIVSSKNKTMTNEEIIARAKQLGMTENTVLDEINHKDDEQDVDVTDDSTDANKTDDSGKADADKKDVSSNADGSNTSQKSDDTDNVANVSASEENEASDVLGRNSQAGTRKTDSGVDAEAGDAESKTNSPDAESKTDNTDTNNKNDSSETKPSGTDTVASDKPMVITIGKGDGSYSVSKKLADVGAIESAGDFDTFLCENGYDKKIRTGTYTIPANASDEQMARILTGIE